VASLPFGLVYDLLGSYPRRPGDPDDVAAEYESEEAVEMLEQVVHCLGHRPLRLGSPHALLAKLGKGELPGLDVAPVDGWNGQTPGRLDADLEAEFSGLALRAYAALECRDFARAGFRLDAANRPRFFEMNPVPTFARDGSFGILAELEGRPLAELLAEVLAGGLERLGLA
jgi:hypothetical protein